MVFLVFLGSLGVMFLIILICCLVVYTCVRAPHG